MPLKDFLIWLNVQLDSDKIRPEPVSCFVSFFNQALDPGWGGGEVISLRLLLPRPYRLVRLTYQGEKCLFLASFSFPLAPSVRRE